jgi:homoserine kinase type II
VFFDKPLVSPSDVFDIMSRYPFGSVVACENMGGIPNSNYHVVTKRKEIALRVYSHGQTSVEHTQFEMMVLEHLKAKNFPSPRPILATNGQTLQYWKGYTVCAFDFIPGTMAANEEFTPELIGGVGRLVAAYERAMCSFEMSACPSGETFAKRGEYALWSLEAALRRRVRGVTLDLVRSGWYRASHAWYRNVNRARAGIIHADIWPKNVICQQGSVAALIDFDDCCCGPVVTDVAIALMEFSMYRDVSMNRELATLLLANYLRNGGRISDDEAELIIEIMVMTCAMWFAYYVVQAETLEEGRVYLSRLSFWQDEKHRGRLRTDIKHCLKEAYDLA